MIGSVERDFIPEESETEKRFFASLSDSVASGVIAQTQLAIATPWASFWPDFSAKGERFIAVECDGPCHDGKEVSDLVRDFLLIRNGGYSAVYRFQAHSIREWPCIVTNILSRAEPWLLREGIANAAQQMAAVMRGRVRGVRLQRDDPVIRRLGLFVDSRIHRNFQRLVREVQSNWEKVR